MTRHIRCLLIATLVACAAPQESRAPASAADRIVPPGQLDGGTNAPEDKGKEPEPYSSHHLLDLADHDLVEASVELRVDEVPSHGLRFFALQVDFGDVAWAHGGWQMDPKHGKVNWGGLTHSHNYQFEDHKLETLRRIQNMPGRLAEVSWKSGTWYRYIVYRGAQETLAPGAYAVLDEEPMQVAESRTMWRWNFEIREIETDTIAWQHHLYVAAPVMTRMLYWTETGSGIQCEDRLTVNWRNPSYKTVRSQVAQSPLKMFKSLNQSTCESAATTDIRPIDNGGHWGTVQTYGLPRPADSKHGGVLYEQ